MQFFLENNIEVGIYNIVVTPVSGEISLGMINCVFPSFLSKCIISADL